MSVAIAKRVLILEDESQLATRIADLLEDAGYEVAGPVRNVLEAKRIVGLDGVDCAVLNADLAAESPLSLAEEIARQGAPVLLISNRSPRGVRNGRERFRQLQKPFTGEQLVSQVNELFPN
jgi:DNA-binding response OmpR family regulator